VALRLLVDERHAETSGERGGELDGDGEWRRYFPSCDARRGYGASSRHGRARGRRCRNGVTRHGTVRTGTRRGRDENGSRNAATVAARGASALVRSERTH
jgi:hypothetical protein